MGFPGVVGDAFNEVRDVAEGGFKLAEDTVNGAVDLAGDALNGLGSLGAKTANGLWDIAEDGYDAVVGAASQALDYLWSLVPEPIRHPFGDSAPLHHAAAGWRDVLASLDGANTSTVAGGRALAAAWDGGASDRFLDFLGDLTSAADQLADDVESLAEALEQAAKAIDDLNHMVHAIAAELAATLVISVVLGLVTGGTAGVAVMAARVTSMVARVIRAVRSARAIMVRARLAVAAVRSSRVGRWLETEGNAIKVASTVGGNAVGTGVATGKSPLQWSASDWAGIGIGSGVSLGAARVVRAHGLNPDHLGVTVGSGAIGNGITTTLAANVQGEVPGVKDLGIGILAGGAGAGAGAKSVRHLQGTRPRPTHGQEAVGRIVEGDVQGLVTRVASPPSKDENDDNDDTSKAKRQPRPVAGRPPSERPHAEPRR